MSFRWLACEYHRFRHWWGNLKVAIVGPRHNGHLRVDDVSIRRNVRATVRRLWCQQCCLKRQFFHAVCFNTILARICRSLVCLSLWLFEIRLEISDFTCGLLVEIQLSHISSFLDYCVQCFHIRRTSFDHYFVVVNNSEGCVEAFFGCGRPSNCMRIRSMVIPSYSCT